MATPPPKKPRELKLGERVVVNLSQMGLGVTCVGTVTELKELNKEEDRAVVIIDTEDGPALKKVQLLSGQRKDAWELIPPGCWASIELLHTSMGGFF